MIRHHLFAKHRLTLPLLLSALGAGVVACSAKDPGATDPGSPDGPDDPGNINNPGGLENPGGIDGGVITSDCTSECTDFPEAAFFDTSAGDIDDGDISSFSDPESFSDGALCVHEPQLGKDGSPGSLLPANWLRPRFRWSSASPASVYEVRLSHQSQVHDLVAYTRNTSWTLPEEQWSSIAKNVHTPITVTIRATSPDGPVGTRGTFQIAPVEARGSMVFWATTTKKVSKDGSYLLSFSIGSENVARALDLNQVTQQTERAGNSSIQGITNYDGYTIRDESSDANKPGHEPGEIQCIGCHTSTPDGDAVLFVDDWPWGKVAANVDPDTGSVGSEPSYVSPGGTALLRLPFQGTPTMSPAHWSEGNRMMITSLAERTDQLYYDAGVTWSGANLVWMNLETDLDVDPYVGADPYNNAQARNTALLGAEDSAWGHLALAGETYESAVTPDWSHDGTRIAYTATNDADNGHPSKSSSAVPADIHLVDYNDGQGGPITALVGASDETAKEYYPAFSQDDKFVAFNRAASGTPYYNSGSEIYIVPSEGGVPRRLAANDPPACSGEVSPGITNSWAKWSPNVISTGGKSYYFLVFSSARDYAGQFEMTDPWAPGAPPQKSAQLYMAAVVVDEATGDVTDYPSVYLWNQNRLVEDGVLTPTPSSNLTPAWDSFKIPPPPVIR